MCTLESLKLYPFTRIEKATLAAAIIFDSLPTDTKVIDTTGALPTLPQLPSVSDGWLNILQKIIQIKIFFVFASTDLFILIGSII